MVDECNAPCPWVEDVSERVNKMEEKVHDLDKRGSITDKVLARVEQAFDKNTGAIISIDKTIRDIEKTMITMQSEIKNNAIVTTEIKNEVGQIKIKFEEAEEKSKIDLRIIFKDFITNKIVQVSGLSLTGIYLITEIIKKINWEEVSIIFRK